jgi:hypothetical protein
MKGLIRSAVVVTLACVALLTATTSWAVKPMDYVNDPFVIYEPDFFDCSAFGMDFLLSYYITVHDYGRMHFDKEGNLVRINGFNYYTDGVTWNNSDPGKNLTSEDYAGRGEHRHYVVNFDELGFDVGYKETGIDSKMIVPGYGPVWVSVGNMKWEWDWDLFAWVPTVFTPKRIYTEEQFLALCTYLQ